MTFSLTARDPRTGAFGIVISSSSPAVAARCTHLAPGAGAVASQNVTNPALGMKGLELLAKGCTANEVIAQLVTSERFPAYRQLAVIDRDGDAATFEGAATLGVHNVAKGTSCVAAGNLLAGPDVPAAMIAAYTASTAPAFERRLLDGLCGGLAAGGEAGQVRSAGLAVVEDVEVWARRLIAYCGLEWDDACLRFYESGREVRTASSAQVRRPIYKGSVGRWRPFAHHLGPLLEALGQPWASARDGRDAPPAWP